MGILSLILALLGLLGAGISGGGGDGGSGSGSFSSGSSSFIINPPAIIQPLGEEVVGSTDYGDAPYPPYGKASHGFQERDWLGSGVSQESTYGDPGWVDEFDDGVSWSPSNFIPGQPASISFIMTAYNSSRSTASWDQYVRIWVDWDQSGSWEPDENIFPSPSYRYYRYVDDLAPGGLLQEEITQGFIVPSDALLGTTWLRARIGRGIMASASLTPLYGECEDYPVNVVPEPATLLLFGVTLSGLWLFGRTRKKLNKKGGI